MKTKFPTRFPSFSAEDFFYATPINLLTSARKRKTLEDRAEKFQAAKFFFRFFCQKFCFFFLKNIYQKQTENDISSALLYPSVSFSRSSSFPLRRPLLLSHLQALFQDLFGITAVNPQWRKYSLVSFHVIPAPPSPPSSWIPPPPLRPPPPPSAGCVWFGGHLPESYQVVPAWSGSQGQRGRGPAGPLPAAGLVLLLALFPSIIAITL